MSLRVKIYAIQFEYGEKEDADLAIKKLEEIMKEIKEYFDGNQETEILIDPLLMISQILQRGNKMKESMTYLTTAEQIVKGLQGDLNDRMLDIYTQYVELTMYAQSFQEAFKYLDLRTQLSMKLHGVESEQYARAIEDEILVHKDLGDYNIMHKVDQHIKDLVRIHQTENNETILFYYKQLFEIKFLMLQQENESFPILQKMISITKALFGNDVANINIANHLFYLGLINGKLGKFADAITAYEECKKIAAKLPPEDNGAQFIQGSDLQIAEIKKLIQF